MALATMGVVLLVRPERLEIFHLLAGPVLGFTLMAAAHCWMAGGETWKYSIVVGLAWFSLGAFIWWAGP